MSVNLEFAVNVYTPVDGRRERRAGQVVVTGLPLPFSHAIEWRATWCPVDGPKVQSETVFWNRIDAIIAGLELYAGQGVFHAG